MASKLLLVALSLALLVGVAVAADRRGSLRREKRQAWREQARQQLDQQQQAMVEVSSRLHADEDPAAQDAEDSGPDPSAEDTAYYSKMYHGAADRLSKGDVKCVLCQYFVQRIQGEILIYSTTVDPEAAAVAGRPFSHHDRGNNDFAAEGEEPVFLETGSKTEESLPPMGWASRRYRVQNMLRMRPRSQRYASLNNPVPNEDRERARAAYRQMYQTIYKTFESMCSKRMPQPYLGYCATIADDYRDVATGLHFGDRPDEICMNIEFCEGDSYIRQSPHSVYRSDSVQIPGDIKDDNAISYQMKAQQAEEVAAAMEGEAEVKKEAEAQAKAEGSAEEQGEKEGIFEAEQEAKQKEEAMAAGEI